MIKRFKEFVYYELHYETEFVVTCAVMIPLVTVCIVTMLRLNQVIVVDKKQALRELSEMRVELINSHPNSPNITLLDDIIHLLLKGGDAWLMVKGIAEEMLGDSID